MASSKKNVLDEINEMKINYGEGIKTVRLWNERIIDIEDLNSEEME